MRSSTRLGFVSGGKVVRCGVLACTVMLMGGVAARGEVLFYDGFGYTAGTSLDGKVNANGNAWTSGGSQPFTVAGSSLSYLDLQTSGGSAVSGAPSSGSAYSDGLINTGLGTPNSGVYWVSFLEQQTGGGSAYQGAYAMLEDFYGNKFVQAGSAFTGNSPNDYVVGPGGSYGYFGANAFPTLDTGSATASTVFIVLKYDFGTADGGADNKVTAYFNPTPGAPEGSLVALGSVSTNSDTVMSLGAIRLGVENQYNGDVIFDELRIGTSFADVAPVAVVPEGGAVVGVVVPVMLLGRRRR